MNLSTQSQFASKASKLLSWGHWFTFSNILLALIISLAYLIADDAPNTLMGQLYLALNWVGHIGFLTFLCFVLTIFPLSLIFPYPRHIRGMAAIIATFGMTLLAFDAYVYVNLGYHINMSAIEQIVALFWSTLSSNPTISIFMSGCVVIFILCFELITSNHAWRHIDRLQATQYKKTLSGLFVLCFVSSHLIHIWADATVNLDITKQDNTLPLSYPTTAKSLLAKNNLIDIEQYKKAKNVELNLTASYLTPKIESQCSDINTKAEIVIFKTHELLSQFISQDTKQFAKTSHFFQLADESDNLFSLIYAIPAFYKKPIAEQRAQPAWLQSGVSASFTNLALTYLESTHDADLNITLITSSDDIPPVDKDIVTYAFALPIEASSPLVKSTLYSSDKRVAYVNSLVTMQDLLPTLFTDKFNCPKLVKQVMLGNSFYSPKSSAGVNYTQDTLIAYKKDKITYIYKDGTHQSESAQQGFLLDDKLEVPLIVESVKKLRRFIDKD